MDFVLRSICLCLSTGKSEFESDQPLSRLEVSISLFRKLCFHYCVVKPINLQDCSLVVIS